MSININTTNATGVLRMNAKFIGTNSLGYYKNRDYDLRLTFTASGRIYMTSTSGTQACEYETWSGFVRNWKIRNINSIDIKNNESIFPKSILSQITPYSRIKKLRKLF